LDVETAKAQLATVEAAEKYRAAKLAYQKDPKKKPAFVKARTAHVEATNNWRNNYRTVPDGPGDGTAAPAPITTSLEVN